jgi:hypothetical protein
MKTKYMLTAIPAGILLALGMSIAGQAQAAETFSEMFTKGKAGISFRYRFEFVDQDRYTDNALASTLRGRLNFRTDDWKGFGVFVEGDYVGTIGWDDYNAGAGNTPDKTMYPVVADPTGPDLNQAYISWKHSGRGEARAGRQRIIYDDARFIGNVGWRQNEQTFDAATYRWKNDAGVDLQFGYIDQVKRIFGQDVPAGSQDMNTWVANLSKDWEGAGKLTGYYYDIDNEDAPASSNVSYGVRFDGSHKKDKIAFGYAAEFAHQTNTGDNPVDYSADYYRLDFSVGFAMITPYIGFESLGGDDQRLDAMFRTPLATLHAFNGWADKFLDTPPAGLNDLFLGAKGSLGNWNWNVVYHDFKAESGGEKYGRELDASVGTSFAKYYGVLFKAAFFDASGTSIYADTTKLWVQLTADF